MLGRFFGRKNQLNWSFQSVAPNWQCKSSLLQDGRKYICATEDLTAADITFASLAYPLILPEEKASVFVSWDDDLPKEFRSEVQRLRETLAGKYVLRIYKEERHL